MRSSLILTHCKLDQARDIRSTRVEKFHTNGGEFVRGALVGHMCLLILSSQNVHFLLQEADVLFLFEPELC